MAAKAYAIAASSLPPAISLQHKTNHQIRTIAQQDKYQR